jgi:hypothetical protein
MRASKTDKELEVPLGKDRRGKAKAAPRRVESEGIKWDDLS